MAGIHYEKPEGQTFPGNSFTICTRFNYKMLGLYVGSRIFSIGGGMKNPEGGQTEFIFLSALYPITWLGLGYSDEVFMTWTLKYQEENNFMIWKTNKWHHFCIAFDEQTLRVSVVNVNYSRDSIS